MEVGRGVGRFGGVSRHPELVEGSGRMCSTEEAPTFENMMRRSRRWGHHRHAASIEIPRRVCGPERRVPVVRGHGLHLVWFAQVDGLDLLVTIEDGIDAVGGGRAHGYGLADEAAADEADAVAEADAALVPDLAHLVVRAVADRRHRLREGAGTRGVAAGRWPVVGQGGVGALLVVGVAEAVEARLAGGQIVWEGAM